VYHLPGQQGRSGCVGVAWPLSKKGIPHICLLSWDTYYLQAICEHVRLATASSVSRALLGQGRACRCSANSRWPLLRRGVFPTDPAYIFVCKLLGEQSNVLSILCVHFFAFRAEEQMESAELFVTRAYPHFCFSGFSASEANIASFRARRAQCIVALQTSPDQNDHRLTLAPYRGVAARR
jgi:hypothetical protein